MGFDDLARHMAGRDNKRLGAPAANAQEFLANAAEANRRDNRTRDLVLGAILLIGGLVLGAIYALYLRDALNPTPSPGRPPSGGTVYYSGGLVALVIGMLIGGVVKITRGIRARTA